MVMSPIQKQLEELEQKSEVLDRIISVAKTPGGRISEDGKNLVYILRTAGMEKSTIAKLLDVTPSALTKYK